MKDEHPGYRDVPGCSRGDVLVLRVIDGFQPERVRVVHGPINQHPIPPSKSQACHEGNHCACHGDGPFFCCRCGAAFTPLSYEGVEDA